MSDKELVPVSATALPSIIPSLEEFREVAQSSSFLHASSFIAKGGMLKQDSSHLDIMVYL